MSELPDTDYVTHNEQPKPRVLLSWEGDDKPAIEAALSRCAGSVTELRRFREVRELDYQVLITDRLRYLTSGGRMLSDHLCVLWRPVPSIDGPDRGADRFVGEAGPVVVEVEDAQQSMEIALSRAHEHEDFEPVLRPLLESELDRRPHPVFVLSSLTDGPSRRLPPHRPLMATSDGGAIALTYERSATSEGVALPSSADCVHLWVEVCLRRWSRLFGQFPIVGAWTDDPRWQTVGQEAVATERSQRLETIERLTLEIDGLGARAEEELTKAILGPRRLLEEKGPTLAEAVIDALRTLGFDVTDLDAEGELADGGGKAEDLRLTDPDGPTFDPVVEVKGYERGVKAGDLLKLQRHRTRAEKAGRSPSATWWIVNHDRTTPPDERPMVLKGEDAMIEEESKPENLGLVVIDTRDLFLAAKAVEAGTIDAAMVRASLREASGRWDGLPDEG